MKTNIKHVIQIYILFLSKTKAYSAVLYVNQIINEYENALEIKCTF